MSVLANEYRRYAAEIAERLGDMPDADSRRRRELYLAILLLLGRARSVLRMLLVEELSEFALAENRRLSALSEEDALLLAATVAQISAVETQQAAMYLEKSFQSIKAFAATLQDGNFALRKLTRKQQTGADLRRVLREKLVGVVAENGLIYRYEPGYYVDLVVNVSEGDISKKIAVEQAKHIGSDLVQVVGPSSKHGYCQQVLGKVFSISGTHPQHPPVSSLYNGGAPFHSFCSHRMRAVIES